ncbi:MAG: sel1 repeat family protein [Lentisphaerae bacterium]|nr:sel1 repeat family protein [Lentisphaerota bacterium]
MFNCFRKHLAAALLLTWWSFSGHAAAAAESKLPRQQLLERARQGDAAAQLEIGYLSYRQNNPVRAAYWFNAAALQGLPEAQYNLGCCFMEGFGVEKNLHRAMECFQQAAASGKLPHAELMLCQLYLNGIAAVPDAQPPRPAIAPDEKAAFAILEKLSNSGNNTAKIIYAGYLIKKYRNQQPGKIIQLLEQAALHDTNGQIMLADFLLSRTDELRDEKRARALLESAAATNHEAMGKLAFAVENGFGAPPDPAAAFKLYQRSIQTTFSPLAAVRLANYYYSGSYGVEQNIPYAVELYTRAAAAGVPEALYRLGVCFSSGVGVQQDHLKAFDLFFQAAKMDYPQAQYELGRAFESGRGTPENQAAAFYWYNQAAVRYEPRALLETGRRYLEGKGTEADPAKAVIFLEQALANGMNEAGKLLPAARKRAAAAEVRANPLPEFGLKPAKLQ